LQADRVNFGAEINSAEGLSDFLDRVIEGDCLAILRQLPDECVDMAFADPPFNLGKSYDRYRDRKRLEEYLAWCRAWLTELVRVTKPTGSIFVHNIPKWLTYFAAFLNERAYFRHWIAWDAPGQPLGKTLYPRHYGILYYTKSPKGFKFYDLRCPHPRCRECEAPLKDYGGKKSLMHPFGPLVSDVWTDIHRIRHKIRRDEHPCQLPEPLLERLILMCTDEGDIVLDPFVGTGTTAVAAKKLGRRFIAIDLDPKYVAIAQRKLRLVQPTKIGGCYVSIYLGRVVTIRDKDWEKLRPFLEAQEGTVSLRGKQPAISFPLFGD
jgi:site-specific DNA-methyltransferase (adenine-specific)